MPRILMNPPQESTKAAAAYSAYELMGPQRSLAKLSLQLYGPDVGKKGAKVGQLERWSSQFDWVARARAYDDDQRIQASLRRQAAIDEMDERQARIAVEQQAKMIAHIDRLIAANAFGSIAAVTGLKNAIDQERTARGAVVQSVDVTMHGLPPVVEVQLAAAPPLLPPAPPEPQYEADENAATDEDRL